MPAITYNVMVISKTAAAIKFWPFATVSYANCIICTCLLLYSLCTCTLLQETATTDPEFAQLLYNTVKILTCYSRWYYTTNEALCSVHSIQKV